MKESFNKCNNCKICMDDIAFKKHSKCIFFAVRHNGIYNEDFYCIDCILNDGDNSLESNLDYYIDIEIHMNYGKDKHYVYDSNGDRTLVDTFSFSSFQWDEETGNKSFIRDRILENVRDLTTHRIVDWLHLA